MALHHHHSVFTEAEDIKYYISQYREDIRRVSERQSLAMEGIVDATTMMMIMMTTVISAESEEPTEESITLREENVV